MTDGPEARSMESEANMSDLAASARHSASVPGPRSGTVAEIFADLVVRQSYCTQSDEVIHAAKRCIIDWFAAAIPGTLCKQAEALERGLFDELGRGPSRTLSGKRAPMRVAALINGTASHTVEFDDIFSPAIYHPGSPVIAAALASAIGLRKTGRDLINGVIAGYEVSTRLGSALGREHYRYWHSTGTVGTVGAAAAVSLLHDLDRSTTAHALGTATTLAAGLQAAFRGGSEIKPLHAGHAADAGHIAAAMAQGGVCAAPDMFEGSVGIGASMSRDVDWQAALSDLDHFNITRITIKNHGCCGHIFAALDGVMTLRDRNGFAAADVARLRVGGYAATVDVTDNLNADTPEAARFCLPFIVASGIVHGSIRLDAFTRSRLDDPRVRALMPKIEVTLDPEVDALFPRQRAARVEIELHDGRILKHFQPHRIGDPELPLSDAALNAKFRELVGGVIASDVAETLLHALWDIENRTDLGFTCDLSIGAPF